MKTRRFVKLPIAAKLSLSMMLLVAISVLFFAFVMVREEQQHTQSELLRVGRLITEMLAKHTTAVMRKDRDALQHILEVLGEDSPDISVKGFITYAVILDQDGTLLASIGEPLYRKHDRETLAGRLTQRAGSNRDEIVEPIVHAGESIATLHVGISQSHRKQILDVVTTKARWTIVALLAASTICSVVLARSLARPLIALANCAKRIGEGHWGETVAIGSSDEIGDLAANFNEMSMRLESAFHQVQQAQDQLIQAQKFSAMGKLSSALAHQLKNPLTSLTMIVEAAMAGRHGFDCTRQDGDVMLSEVRRMDRAVTDILAVAGERRLNARPADVNELIRHAVAAVKYRLDVAGIQLDLSLDSGIPVAPCDTDQMEQVFLNLIVNAVEAMPSGGRLGIETTWNAAAATAQITIRDTGAGVSEAARSQIFDPFFTTKEKGSGLGLSIAYTVIRKHGGRIALVSQKNVGATFVLTLPMREANDAPHSGRG
jgi:signal transduction histidine kinase